MIGLIDSGKGGLTTLATIINAGGKGEFFYLSDEKNAPYGNKCKAELLDLLIKNLLYLKNTGCDRVILACNTLSLALDENIILPLPVRKLKLPDYDKTKRTLFTATYYSVKIIRERKELNLVPLALPELSKLIDDGNYDFRYLEETISDRCFDQVILGCTHYGLIRDDFQRLFPNAIISDMNEKTPLELVKEVSSQSDVIVYLNRKYRDLLSSIVKVKLTYR